MAEFKSTNSIESSVVGSFSSAVSSLGSNITSSEYILNLINAMDKKSSLTDNAYKEIVRFLISKFNNLPYVNNELETVQVNCRYGNPERTIAKLNSHDNAVLPLITLSQNSVVEADDRRRIGTLFMNDSIWNEELQRAERVVSLCDRPVTIKYSLNVWAKYMEDLDQLAQKIRLVFNPSLILKTKVTQNSAVFLEAEDNNYSFTLADREDRILRKNFTLSVETYIKNPKYKITSTGKIEELNLEIDAY